MLKGLKTYPKKRGKQSSLTVPDPISI